ncbi:nitroreductase [Actinoplanes sp. KI2]|uniref:Acg family FMN-binding oxidoreductase n=1 Tax=Actinoplanes sp. KI2 TaxID=2983315 RepID=UPI0021D5DB61|nr:nitroreductase [Actinoplanes sp. KI2]MCU7729440.1 nitroreductase [Actinoplanes sp. KI2]
MTPLETAARTAQHAPSVLNTQPWAWRITGDLAELFADPDRRVESIDPDGRLLLLSCGAALHHACIALNAGGWGAAVERIPDPARPDLLARIRLTSEITPDPETQRMSAALCLRRTDRRAFTDQPVADHELTKLRRLVEAAGAYLHVVRPDQVAMLAISTELAAGAELDDPAYRADLRRWTSRPSFTGDGVPPATAVRPELRRVPIRDFVPGGSAGLRAGAAHDAGAAYVVLFGDGAQPLDFLRGGEALSALLLMATADGLSTAPLSDAVEVGWPHHLLRGLLSGIGDPYLVVRLGHPAPGEPLPPTPRRDPRDVITVVQ